MKKLNNTELFAAQEIINAGLLNAAESLSFFMKEKVNYDKIMLSDNFIGGEFEISKKQEANVHVLITEVIGDLRGICYLIFSEDEANQLKKASLSNEANNNPSLLNQMGDALMLEIDNIIAASVITQFSNYLELKIYGGVPGLKKMNFSELKGFLKNDPQQGLYTINFKITFNASGLKFSPEFLWLFDDTFIQCIENFCADKNKIEKLKSTVL